MLDTLRPTRWIWLLAILMGLLVFGNHWVLEQLTDIRHLNAPLPHRALPDNVRFQPSEGETVRIGVVSRFAPTIIYRLYQPIMDYLNAHSSRHHTLILSQSYQDAAEQLKNGEVQASFLGAWMCFRLPPDSGLEPVAIPVNAEGRSRFQVALVTAEASPITSLADLEGCRVAVPSDQAFSGNWLQNGGLEAAGLTVADLDTIQHFKHHETVVWEVMRGNFQAGVVKMSLATRYQGLGLRTVARSQAIPGPPLVVNAAHRDEAVEELVRLLLALDHTNAQDRRLLETWTPEFAYGFIPVDGAAFREGFRDVHPDEGRAP